MRVRCACAAPALTRIATPSASKWLRIFTGHLPLACSSFGAREDIVVAARHTSISATIIFDACLPASIPSIVPALEVIANIVAIALGTDHLGISLTGLCGKHNTYWPYSLRLAWSPDCRALQQIWARDFRFGSFPDIPARPVDGPLRPRKRTSRGH